jgi:hypothetical protein
MPMQYADRDTQLHSGEPGFANPHRLDVFTSSVREVVEGAGGWIVDRVLAGWTVTIISDAANDAERAARILGSGVVLRNAKADGPRPRPYGIALTSALYDTDRELQKRIRKALDQRSAEITLIGSRPGGQCDPRLHPVTYRLSSAARAYKASALAAAGLTNSSAVVTESFLGAAMHRPAVAASTRRRAGRIQDTTHAAR